MEQVVDQVASDQAALEDFQVVVVGLEEQDMDLVLMDLVLMDLEVMDPEVTDLGDMVLEPVLDLEATVPDQGLDMATVLDQNLLNMALVQQVGYWEVVQGEVVVMDQEDLELALEATAQLDLKLLSTENLVELYLEWELGLAQQEQELAQQEQGQVLQEQEQAQEPALWEQALVFQSMALEAEQGQRLGQLEGELESPEAPQLLDQKVQVLPVDQWAQEVMEISWVEQEFLLLEQDQESTGQSFQVPQESSPLGEALYNQLVLEVTCQVGLCLVPGLSGLQVSLEVTHLVKEMEREVLMEREVFQEALAQDQEQQEVFQVV